MQDMLFSQIVIRAYRLRQAGSCLNLSSDGADGIEKRLRRSHIFIAAASQ
jgi:hypothetical protein